MVAGGVAVCPPLYTWGQAAAVEQYNPEEGCWKLCGQSKDWHNQCLHRSTKCEECDMAM